MTVQTVSITQFAFNLAAVTSKTRDASLPFHVAYIAATPTQQAQLKHDWMLGHIQGALWGAHNEKDAERILSRGKGAGVRPVHIAAIDKAYSDFRYHVVRKAKATVAHAKKPVRISAGTKQAAQAFIEEAGDIDAAIAVLKALKARK